MCIARLLHLGLLISVCLYGCDRVRTRNPNFAWSSTGTRLQHGLRASGYFHEDGSGMTEAVLFWRGEKQRAMDAEIIMLWLHEGELVDGIAVGGSFLFPETNYPHRIARLCADDLAVEHRNGEICVSYSGLVPTVELQTKDDHLKAGRTWETFLSFEVVMRYNEGFVKDVLSRIEDLGVQKFAPPFGDNGETSPHQPSPLLHPLLIPGPLRSSRVRLRRTPGSPPSPRGRQ